MEIKEYKKVNDVNKKYFRVIGMKCDCCKKEIEEQDLYLEVDYDKEKYDDTLKYKQFCKHCMKDSMYDMFMNNWYTHFQKYNFIKDDNWQECDYDD